MALSLAEYAAQNPQEIPAQELAAQAEAKSIADRQRELEKAEALKVLIAQEVTAGKEPQTILYTAISCIGLLTNDAAWAEAAQQNLDTVYADLAQQSFIEDRAAQERERLDKLQAEYNANLSKDIQRRMRQLDKIRGDLSKVLETLILQDIRKPENDDFLK